MGLDGRGLIFWSNTGWINQTFVEHFQDARDSSRILTFDDTQGRFPFSWSSLITEMSQAHPAMGSSAETSAQPGCGVRVSSQSPSWSLLGRKGGLIKGHRKCSRWTLKTNPEISSTHTDKEIRLQKIHTLTRRSQRPETSLSAMSKWRSGAGGSHWKWQRHLDLLSQHWGKTKSRLSENTDNEHALDRKGENLSQGDFTAGWWVCEQTSGSVLSKNV